VVAFCKERVTWLQNSRLPVSLCSKPNCQDFGSLKSRPDLDPR
jgi:hypothetical protein